MRHLAAGFGLGLWLLALSGSSTTCGAQAPARELILDSLRTPVSPALVLMGIAPTAIERPTTPKALATVLIAAVKESNGFPRNGALEVSPYWLVPHPQLSFDDYYNANLSQSLLQTLSISLATSRLPELAGEIGGTAVGVGLRTSPSSGRAHPTLQLLADSLRDRQTELSRRVAQAVRDRDSAAIRRISAEYEEDLRDLALRMQAVESERIGFLLDAAGGVVLDFPGDLADSGFVSRAGVWLAPTYRPHDAAIEIIGLLRYTLDRRSGIDRNTFDFGARTILEVGQLSGSLEFIEHAGDDYPLGQSPSYRLAGNLEYRVGASSIVSLTIGRDESIAGDGAAELVAQLGVNLGFGQVPLLRLGPR
jgi:hypothetical protein